MAEILRYTLSHPSYLPSSYTPVAYLENPSTAYIDTGFKYGSGDMMVYVDYTMPTETNATICGSSNDNSKWCCLIYHYNGSRAHYCGTLSDAYAKSTTSGDRIKVYLGITGSNLVVKDDRYDVTNKTGYSASCGTIPSLTYTYTLFAYHYTSITQNAKSKMYACKIWYQGSLVRDFHPCYYQPTSSSTPVYGMFDVVQLKFYSSASSTAFTGGPVLCQSLPSEYQQVEYLEGTGTLYFNISRTVKSNTINKVTLSLTTKTDNAYYQIGGYATSSSWQPYAFGYRNSAFTPYGGTMSLSAIPTTMTTVTFTSSNSAEVSGSSLGFFHIAGSPGSYPLASMKCWNWLVLEGTTLVYNLVPCYRRSDMKPGMYDTVGLTFYTNSGSGEFLLGPSLPWLAWEGNSCNMDMMTKQLTDGSRWARIFYHNVMDSDHRYWCTSSTALDCNSGWIFSRMKNVDLYKTSAGVYEFMLCYPNLSSTGYNRWTLTSSPNASSVTGFTAVTTTWSSYNKGIAKSANSSTVWNCNAGGGTWFGSIGQISGWTNSSMPAADGSQLYLVELWVRIDNTPCSWMGLPGIPYNLHSSPLHPQGVYHNLPSGYLEVEYVEFLNKTGYLYITTDTLWSAVNKVEFKVNIKSRTGSNYCMIFANSGWDQAWISSNTSGWQNGSLFTALTRSPSSISLNTPTDVTLSGITCTSSNKVRIGCWTDTTTWSTNWLCYAMTFYNSSNTVISQLIPCIRTSDKVVGMYDLINSTFYASESSVSNYNLSAGPAVGRLEGGIEFTGSNSYLQATALPSGTIKTVSFWARFDTLSNLMVYSDLTNKTMFGLYNSGTTGYTACSSGTSGWYTCTLPTLSTGTWYHIAITYGNPSKVYINGLVCTNTTSADYFTHTDGGLLIGHASAYQPGFDGVMYDFRIWNDIKDATFIQSLYLSK